MINFAASFLSVKQPCRLKKLANRTGFLSRQATCTCIQRRVPGTSSTLAFCSMHQTDIFLVLFTWPFAIFLTSPLSNPVSSAPSSGTSSVAWSLKRTDDVFRFSEPSFPSFTRWFVVWSTNESPELLDILRLNIPPGCFSTESDPIKTLEKSSMKTSFSKWTTDVLRSSSDSPPTESPLTRFGAAVSSRAGPASFSAPLLRDLEPALSRLSLRSSFSTSCDCGPLCLLSSLTSLTTVGEGMMTPRVTELTDGRIGTFLWGLK